MIVQLFFYDIYEIIESSDFFNNCMPIWCLWIGADDRARYLRQRAVMVGMRLHMHWQPVRLLAYRHLVLITRYITSH